MPEAPRYILHRRALTPGIAVPSVGPQDYYLRFTFDDCSGDAVGDGPGATTLTGKDIYTGLAKHGTCGAATTYPFPIFSGNPDDSCFFSGVPYITLGDGVTGWSVSFWTYEHPPAPVAQGGPHNGNSDVRLFAHTGVGGGDAPLLVSNIPGNNPVVKTRINGTDWTLGIPAATWDALTGWHHLAIVGRAAAVETDVYLDAVLWATVPDVSSAALRSLLNISGTLGGGQLWGAVDEVAWWLRPLTDPEIATLAAG